MVTAPCSLTYNTSGPLAILPLLYCAFTTLIAEVVSFAPVDEVAIERWPFYQEGEFLLSCTCGAGTVVQCRNYLWRQDMKASLFYRIAAVLLLFFDAGHTSGFPWSDPKWGVDLSAMRSTHFYIIGFSRTYWDFYVGFGLFVGVF